MKLRTHTTRALKKYAEKDIRRVSLSQLYTLGRYILKKDLNDYRVFEIPTKFLYEELPIRLSQTIKGICSGLSPYALHRIPEFDYILKRTGDKFQKLISLPPPVDVQSDREFTAVLENMKTWQQENLQIVHRGLRSLSEAIARDDPKIVPGYLLGANKQMLQQNASNYDKVSVNIEEEMSTGPKRRGGASPAINSKGEIKYQFMEDELGIGAGRGGQQAGVGLADTEYLGEDESIFAEHKNTRFFDWFYSMNLGTQLLIEDQLSVRTNNQSYVKKIHPTKVLQNAVETAREVARRQYNKEPPQVEIISPKKEITTVYIEPFLQGILLELLANSIRATMEFHGNTTNYPNIKVVMIEGGEDVTFKVSDEGGGMPHNKISNLWSYIKPNNSNHMMLEGCDSTILDVKDVPLYGYGCGLPSARLVARYFGGDLSAVSMEGYGSDFYLHLLKAGNVQECTPDLHTIKMISSSSSSSVYELMDSIYHGSS